jgi:hypothetical protein
MENAPGLPTELPTAMTSVLQRHILLHLVADMASIKPNGAQVDVAHRPPNSLCIPVLGTQSMSHGWRLSSPSSSRLLPFLLATQMAPREKVAIYGLDRIRCSYTVRE